MTKERFGLVKFDGVDQTIVGSDLMVGDKAPDSVAVGNDWIEVHPLQASAGEVIIRAAVPSLDTGVCDKETRRFNTKATQLGPLVHTSTSSAWTCPSPRSGGAAPPAWTG